LDGLAPGEKSLLWSFNHDAGRWDVFGTGTVSADARTIVSDPGVGVLAPGWHFTDTGTPSYGAGPGVDPVSGTPCLPVLPVHPIDPIVSTQGLDSRLFTRDDQKFTIKLANDAEVPPWLKDDPCEIVNLITPRLVYQIDVDGPAGQFLRGLDDG